MSLPASIVQFSGVTTEPDPLYESAVWNITFNLAPGEMLLICLDKEHLSLPLADAAEGLLLPSHGQVTFLGEDWRTMSADRAAWHRGKIGRVFETEGWLKELPVDENIILSQRHHTDRPDREIIEEATRLARMFGLPGLPRGLPATVRRQDLRKAEIIRALLGQPILIIFENPTRGIYADIIAPLVNAVQTARKRSAAVIWITRELELWNNPGLHATARGRMYGSQLHLVES